jgi:RimJ/RimL family protein N-acetyltransferase
MVTDVPVLSTKRLILRSFFDMDLEEWTEICSDADAMQFAGGPLDREGAWRDIALQLGHWNLRGFGNWALELRETGQLIGRAGLWEPPDWPGVELSWLLGRPWWGHALATEASVKVLEWAIDVLRLKHVVCVVQGEDTGSQEVAHRLGLHYEREAVHDGEPVSIYGRTLRQV